MSESETASVISLLLDEQKKLLSEEIGEKQTQLDKLNELSREIKKLDSFSVESKGDIAMIMENEKIQENFAGQCSQWHLSQKRLRYAH